jgi:putative tryptophan/tyrosine transport system substrate-binding protein
MRRRKFISVIAGAAVWPLGTRAEQLAKPVIGVLAPMAAEKIPHQIAAFRRGLAEAGYVEGNNLTIEYRFADITLRPELMPEVAGDLLRLNMKVIFAAAPEAVAAVRNATTSIHIVALDLESDPVAKGYVKSLARPGGNMTGMFLDIPELSGKQVGLLKEVVPRLSRIAIFGVSSLNAPRGRRSVRLSVGINHRAVLVAVRRQNGHRDGIGSAELLQVEAFDVVILHPDPSPFPPLAIRAEGDVAQRSRITTMSLRSAARLQCTNGPASAPTHPQLRPRRIGHAPARSLEDSRHANVLLASPSAAKSVRARASASRLLTDPSGVMSCYVVYLTNLRVFVSTCLFRRPSGVGGIIFISNLIDRRTEGCTRR